MMKLKIRRIVAEEHEVEMIDRDGTITLMVGGEDLLWFSSTKLVVDLRMLERLGFERVEDYMDSHRRLDV